MISSSFQSRKIVKVFFFIFKIKEITCFSTKFPCEVKCCFQVLKQVEIFQDC